VLNVDKCELVLESLIESGELAQTSCVLSQDNQIIKDMILGSQKFLKIVTFRFDSKELGDLILEKSKNNVDIEVITNPSDNVAKDALRPIVENMYKELIENRVKMHLCIWEAGEPELTPTSVSGKQSASAGIGEKWYTLHLQILINENEALVTSRALTNDDTIDIFYRSSDAEFKKNALQKFEEIKLLFIEPKKVGDLTVPGNATEFLDEKMLKETLDIFRLTKRLNARQYQDQKFPKSTLNKELFITPFNGRMREFLYKFIDSSEEFIYFFLETFFDEDLIGKLQEKIAENPNIKVKIITCPPQRIRQSPQKARAILGQALSLGIQVGNIDNIQGKFWISDAWFAISSGDFNRMNLGHNTTSRYWKSDTQLLLLENDKSVINKMKNEFEEKFYPIDQGCICSKDVRLMLTRMTKKNQLMASVPAFKYLTRFKASLLIKTENDVRYVVETAVALAKSDGKKKLDGVYMLISIILYNLQRREHRLDEIAERLERIETLTEIEKTLKWMLERGQLIKSGDVYRIAPNLKGANADRQTEL
jgi:hypothetical protein